ncbi:MAG: IS110 family transposase [Phycisphaerae bacterium]
MSECSTFVGLDVHAKTIAAAMLNNDTGELKERSFGTTQRDQRKLIRWLGRESEGLPVVCYEAGSWGYELQRRLLEAGIDCRVIAPSLVYQKAGRRRKNDRLDAIELAKQLAAGQLTEVHPPTAAQEASRALVRCRDDARKALHQVRQQLLKFLVQQGVCHEGNPWTKSHRKWLRGLRLPEPCAQLVLADYVLTVEQAEQRLARLDEQIQALSETAEYREAVGALRCFRGVDTLTAMIVLTELYEFGRFASPRALMGYLGLVPGEWSTGDQERGTGLTKTGNGLVRRVLVEAAWQYQRRPWLSAELAKRQSGQPAEAVATAGKAMERLHRRYWRLVNRGKGTKTAACAVARELAGFLWAALQPTLAA